MNNTTRDLYRQIEGNKRSHEFEWVKDGPGPYELVNRRNRKARRAAAARTRSMLPKEMIR